MIHIEITQSPDTEVRGSFKFFQNQIYLGRKSDFVQILDNQLNESHLMIEVVEDSLYVHPQKDVAFYLIDGKRATNIRKVKINQMITIGNTILKIHDFLFTHTPNKKEVLDEKLAQLLEQNSPNLHVIEQLAQMMK
jgi:hypothetical protein